MGEYAELAIEQQFDDLNSKKVKYKFVKDTPAEAKIRAVRKELAILIKEKQKLCSTDQERNRAVTKSRQEINLKYGKDWRERGLIVNDPNQW